MKLPLGLRQCGSCGHVQIGYEVPGHTLYGDYKFRTPPAQRDRLAMLARSYAEMFPEAIKTGNPNVLEIGSNNGIFLEELRKAGFEAVGIDPSGPKNGMPRWFNSKNARMLAETFGKFDLVLSNNTFAHVDDLRNVFLGVSRILSPAGSLIFEVQYFPDMVKGGMFDMIYHEHKDYHTLAPFETPLKKFGMCVYKVEHIDNYGGSIRVYCRMGDKGIPLQDHPIDWKAFKDRIDTESARLNGMVNGSRISAFGATAKACTLIHQFELSDKIAYCVDETPEKQGKYIPGTDIEIVPPQRMKDEPLPVLLTAWNYADILKPRFSTPVIVPFEGQ